MQVVPSLNVFPSCAADDCTDIGLVSVKFICQIYLAGTSRIFSAYGNYLSFSQGCVAIFLSSLKTLWVSPRSVIRSAEIFISSSPFFRSLKSPMVFASLPFASFTLISITHVVGNSSKIKMIRIDASWVVAFVKHLKSVWYFSNIQCPRNAMRSPDLSSKSEIAITKWASRILRGCPFPTPISFANLIPKSELYSVIFGHASLYHRSLLRGGDI